MNEPRVKCGLQISRSANRTMGLNADGDATKT